MPTAFIRVRDPMTLEKMANTEVLKTEKGLLLDYLTRPNYILAIFGFASVPPTCNIVIRFLYGLYSLAVVTLMAFVLARSISLIRVDGVMGTKEIGLILLAIWGAQALFSSIFVIYHSRRPTRMEEFRRVWTQSGCDGLIEYTDLRKVGARYRYVFHAFSIINVGWTASMMLLTYFRVVQPDPWSDNFVWKREYKIYVLLAFIIYSLVAWMLPLYRYYVACFMFRYCWIGFCAKVQKMTLAETSYGDALNYISRQHRQLCDVMRAINRIYGLYVLVILATSLPVIILECYLFAAQSNLAQVSMTLQMAWWLFMSVVQVLMIFSASFITDSAQGTAEAFYGVYERLNKQTIREGEHGKAHLLETSILLQRLNTTNIAVSAWGWFDVSKSGLLGLGSVLLSYYVILVQFTQTATCNCNCGNDTLLGNVTKM